MTEQNIDKLLALFPNCKTEKQNARGELETAIDFDLLKQELSKNIVEGPQERYQLNWPGKKEALLTANAPIAKTLRPCREESVDFDTTENLFIEGDNLDALKLLQETYLGKVKMIYIDPPYNTGNDFIYNDDFSESSEDYLLNTDQKDEEGNRLIANTESNGRFHSDWLSMMYARLKLARNLMSRDGVIFISIDDNELENIKKLCIEIFGEQNFLGLFIVNSSPSGIDYGHMAKTNDYALFFAKDCHYTSTNQLEDEEKEFKYQDEIGGFNLYPLYNGNAAFNDKTRPNLVYPFYLNPENNYEKDFYEISVDKKDGWIEIFPVVGKKDGIQRVWRWGKPKARENVNDEIVGFKNREGEFRVVQKSRLTTKVIRSLQLDNEVSSRQGTLEIETLFGKKVFSYPKPSALIKRFTAVATETDSIILDFFAGSASTAQAIMRLNAQDNGARKYILVQIPEKADQGSIAANEGFENLCDIGKERIRLAGQKIKEEKPEATKLDIGFRVLKIDSSNMENVYYTPDSVAKDDLFNQVEHIKSDRTSEDLLFQVMLDWGVDLSLSIRKETIEGKEVYFVNDDDQAPCDLVACFEKGIDEPLIKALAAKEPLRVVFRDDGFASDSLKINVEQIFKQLAPATDIKVI